jgi:hypothetical protein
MTTELVKTTGTDTEVLTTELVKTPGTNTDAETNISLLLHVKQILQCFIYSAASFLSKLRAKKVEKLHNSSFYRKFRK